MRALPIRAMLAKPLLRFLLLLLLVQWLSAIQAFPCWSVRALSERG
jgi:hypothetical protein